MPADRDPPMGARPATPSNIIKARTPGPGRPPNQGGSGRPPGESPTAAAERRLRAFTAYLDHSHGAFVSALSHAYRLDADAQLRDAVDAIVADLRRLLTMPGVRP